MKWILNVLIIAVVLILGLPYILGLVVEYRTGSLIKLLSDAENIHFELKSYDRGWFSSSSEYSISMNVDSDHHANNTQTTERASPNKTKLLLKMDIAHGPIVINYNDFNQYSVFLGQAFIKFQIMFPEITKTLNTLHFLEQLSILNGETKVYLTGASESNIMSHRLNFADPSSPIHVKWNDVLIKLKLSRNGRTINVHSTINDLTLGRQDLSVNFSKIKINNAYTKLKKYDLWLGSSDIQLPFVMLSIHGRDKVILKDVNFKTRSERTGAVLDSLLEGTFDKLIYQETSYGPAIFDLEMNNLEVKAVSELKKLFHQWNAPELSNQLSKEAKEALLMKLLSRGFRLNLSAFSIKIPDGEVSAFAWVTLPNVYKQAKKSLKYLFYNAEGALFITMPKSLVFKMKHSPLLPANEIGTQLSTKKLTCEEQEEMNVLQYLAKPKEQQFLSWFIANLTNHDINNYQFSVDYKNNYFFVNGKKFNLIEFILDQFIKASGAGGRTRTDTMSPSPDFESGASTNFATPAEK